MTQLTPTSEQTVKHLQEEIQQQHNSRIINVRLTAYSHSRASLTHRPAALVPPPAAFAVRGGKASLELKVVEKQDSPLLCLTHAQSHSQTY